MTFPGDMPPLSFLIEQAQAREKMLTGYDMKVVSEVRNPGAPAPLMIRTTRWVRQGSRLRMEDASVDDPGTPEMKEGDDVVAYNGEVGRSYSAMGRRGRIFRDIREIESYMKNDPFAVSCCCPETRLIPLSVMLKGELANLSSPQNIVLSSTIVEDTKVGDVRVVVVETTNPERQGNHNNDLWRMYFAPGYGYAPVQIDHIWEDCNVRTLGSRTIMRNFVSHGALFHPMEFEYQVFQGQPSLLQTTLHKVVEATWPGESDGKMFELEFPAGTEVYDSTADVRFVAGGENMPSPQSCPNSEH